MKIKEELLDLEDIQRSNKPLLDLFIRRTAVITQTSENLTDLIIRDQWRNANKALAEGSNISQVEVSYLGTFYLSKNKALKRIENLEGINKSLEVTQDPKLLKYRDGIKKRNLRSIGLIKFKLENSKAFKNKKDKINEVQC